MRDQERTGTTGPARRRLIQGVAWSVPVLAAGSAAPAVAASTGDVRVELVSCSRSGTTTRITFQVCATAGTLAVGSTFLLTAAGSWSTGTVSGTLVSNSTFAAVGTLAWQFTLTNPLASGSCYTLTLAVSSATTGTQFTVAVGTVIGMGNGVSTNDSATKTLGTNGAC